MEGESTIKTGLEGLENQDVQGGQGQEGKVEDGTQGPSGGTSGQNAGNGKGSWLTSVPKDIRDVIPEGKYENLWDYVRDLKSGGAKAEPNQTDDAYISEWNAYLEEADKDNPVLKALNGALKESGVSVESAKKINAAIEKASSDTVAEVSAKAKSEREQRAKEYIRKNWGSTKEERDGNIKLYQRCAAEMQKEDPENFGFLSESGLLAEPAIVSLITNLYKGRFDTTPPFGSPGSGDSQNGDYFGIA